MRPDCESPSLHVSSMPYSQERDAKGPPVKNSRIRFPLCCPGQPAHKLEQSEEAHRTLSH